MDFGFRFNPMRTIRSCCKITKMQWSFSWSMDRLFDSKIDSKEVGPFCFDLCLALSRESSRVLCAWIHYSTSSTRILLSTDLEQSSSKNKKGTKIFNTQAPTSWKHKDALRRRFAWMF